MSNNPINLGVRFMLELAGLVAMGYWGWTQHTGLLRWALMLGVPLAAAALWGIFRVPDDPGVPPVKVPGVVRLALEAAFFGLAVVLLLAADQRTAALILGGIVLVHYAVSYDRVIWLFSQ